MTLSVNKSQAFEKGQSPSTDQNPLAKVVSLSPEDMQIKSTANLVEPQEKNKQRKTIRPKIVGLISSGAPN